tara:strand:- start:67886 stop:68617 length:732 start_codon:yes stop_codon:yes gene_type:complete
MVILFAVWFAGCASDSGNYQPPIARREGSWNVEVEKGMLGNFWVNLGPYRTEKINSWHGTTTSETGVQQAGFETKGKPFVFELATPSGDVLHVARGIKRGDKIIKTGQVEIPLGSSWTYLGLITRNGQPLAEFATKLTKDDFLGSSRSAEQSLMVGSRPIVIEERKQPYSSGSSYMQTVGQDYFLDGVKVGSFEFEPSYDLWVEQSAPLEIQHAIVAHVASMVAVIAEAEKQAAAASWSNIRL